MGWDFVARIEQSREANPDHPVTLGTGFLIGPRHLATALHVVARPVAEGYEYGKDLSAWFPGSSQRVDLVPEPDLADGTLDWCILRLAREIDIPSPPFRALHGFGESFQTFGFPASTSRDGLALTGAIINEDSRCRNAPAIQLFAEMGAHLNLRGLSGAPCWSGEAVVGLIHTAMVREGDDARSSQGILYACPIGFIAQRAPDLVITQDESYRFPKPFIYALPNEPYKALAPYLEEDGEIFFGRREEIASFFRLLERPETGDIILLVGQTGVGKSSFLRAGLLSRLRSLCSPSLIIRDPARGFLPSFQAAIDSFEAKPLDGERENRREGLLLADQVEEMFTQPLPDIDELGEVVGYLSSMAAVLRLAKIRVVLSFRKEWLAELEARLARQKILRTVRFFLEPLRRKAVAEIVEGIATFEPAKSHYKLQVEPGLAQRIATDLWAHSPGALAPVLQVLLSRMWNVARVHSPDDPSFVLTLYQQIAREGLHLDDFLDQQLRAVAEKWPKESASGLVLDLLELHTTPLGTGRASDQAERGERYPQVGKIEELASNLRDVWLLLEPAEESARHGSLRLSHDTLAPLVRKRFQRSTLPGQRARRVLEARATSTEETGHPATFDSYDLKLVAGGRSGMRDVTAAERVLLDRSYRKQRTRRLRTIAGALMVSGLVVALGVFAFSAGPFSHWIHQKNVAHALEKSRRGDASLFQRLGSLKADSYTCAWFQSFNDGRLFHPTRGVGGLRSSSLSRRFLVLASPSADEADGRWELLPQANYESIRDLDVFLNVLREGRLKGKNLSYLDPRFPELSEAEAPSIFSTDGHAQRGRVEGGFARVFALWDLTRYIENPKRGYGPHETTLVVREHEHGFVLAGAPSEGGTGVDDIYLLFFNGEGRDQGSWRRLSQRPFFGSYFKGGCQSPRERKDLKREKA